MWMQLNYFILCLSNNIIKKNDLHLIKLLIRNSLRILFENLKGRKNFEDTDRERWTILK
jgi:hypothetical protein